MVLEASYLWNKRTFNFNPCIAKAGISLKNIIDPDQMTKSSNQNPDCFSLGLKIYWRALKTQLFYTSILLYLTKEI